MRPLHLRIQGIGPFAGEENVPFEMLGEGGLYLITGDTGAGKTTVFDSICFALFGEASGEVRDSSTLRSDYARPEQESRVTFSFLQNGKEYTVTRNPAYLRPRLRGQGTTQQAAGAQLTRPDGKIVEGDKEVTRQIEEILGLDRSQFKQTAMIAQGEFLKLLLADTKKRSEIFRKIFGTGLYSSLQERLHQEAINEKRLCEETEQSIRQYMDGIQIASEDMECEATEEIRRLKESGSMDEAEKLPDALCTWLEAKNRKMVLLREETERLEEMSWKVTEALTRVSQENRQKQQLTAEQERLDRYCEQADSQRQEVLFLERCEQVEMLCQPAWLQRQQAKERLLEQEKRLLEKQKEKNNLEQQLPARKVAWERSCKEEARRQVLRDELTRRTARLPERKETYREWRQLLQEKVRLEKLCRENQEMYGHLEVEYRMAASRLEERQLAFYRQQAGVLAVGLEEGKPCPVCGSLKHPHPAAVPGQTVTEEQVRRAQKEKEESLDMLQKLSLTLKEQQTKKEQLEERCLAAEKKLEGWDENRLAAEEKEIEQAQQDLKRQEEEAQAVARAYEKCEKLLLPLAGELENQTRQVQEAERVLQKATEYWEVCLNQEELSGEEEYRKFILDPKEKKQRQKACQAYRELGVNLEGRLQKLREVLEEARQIRNEQGYVSLVSGNPATSEELETALHKKSTELMNARRETEAARSSLEQQIAANERIAAQLKLQLDRRKKQIARWEIYADLDRTAGGALKGQDRLALEQYVQAFYFEQIVERANRRFHEMSGGRYQLGRRQEASSRRIMAGLELEVMDYYTGKRRPVSSLSGGEAFQASLSLALGLSDVVQSMTGGVRIEAMFVDEGFGSLDREAMDLAINTLKGLTEEHFLVGIISHVEELKERIEKKIVVVKGEKGSRITLSV